MSNVKNFNKSMTATQEVQRLYTVHDNLLGKGAFGHVYTASSKNKKSNKFAIKIVQTENMDEETKEQMREELHVLNKLDHPYVAKYEESFEDDRYIYIIMANIRGQHLMKDVEGAEDPRYGEEKSRALMFKLLNAIHHIHTQGIIHRDLKPENIMIDELGDPVVIDFGLSKDCYEQDEELTSYVGSKHFMAPEIVE